MRSEESKLQCACVEWFRLAFPQNKKLLFAVPNGGKRNIAIAAKLKKEGVVAGVLDLFLAIPNTKYHGLFIEMKYGKNGLTEHQKEMVEKFTAKGYRCEVAYSLDEFMQIIKEYLK